MTIDNILISDSDYHRILTAIGYPALDEDTVTAVSDSSESNICLANFCISCGENLGEHNPRQYCYKIYCPYEN